MEPGTSLMRAAAGLRPVTSGATSAGGSGGGSIILRGGHKPSCRMHAYGWTYRQYHRGALGYRKTGTAA